MNTEKLRPDMPPVNGRLQWVVEDENLKDFQDAMAHYEFSTNTSFVKACVAALIKAHKDSAELRRPLRLSYTSDQIGKEEAR